jgi:DMSO/TMAO reductase YedYZ molybdopterin-dependent catalytic subunit
MKIGKLFAVCVVLQIAAWAQQGGTGILQIGGDVGHPRTFQEQDWKQLKHISISATNAHDKKTATYSGVPLRDLLQEAGVPLGENLRGKALAISIVIIASDGYQVTFSIAELDESIGNAQVLVADSEDGKPLGPTAGPLRLVVPGDKRPARWVRMVKAIRVVAGPSAASLQ